MAKIGETGYPTLTAAITACDNNTVILLKDVTESITIDASKTVTLDLNGHKITNVETAKDSDGKPTGTNANSTIFVSGILTVTDSSANKSGEVIMSHEGNNGMAALYVAATGTATINGGYFHNTNALAYYVVKNLGTTTINNGKFYNASTGGGNNPSSVIANGYYSVDADGTYAENNPTMTINGGEFNGLSYVKNDDKGVMYIYGGTFGTSESKGSAIMNWNVMVIGSEDGTKFPTINGTSGSVVLNGYYDNSGMDVGQLTVNAVAKNDNLSLVGIAAEIKNGAILGYYGFGSVTLKNSQVWPGDILNEPKGVEFNGTIQVGKSSDASKVEFSKIKAGANGIVVKAGSVEITGTMNASSSQAQITAESGDVVLKDLTITEGTLTLDETVTVEGTLTVNAGAKIAVGTDAELKVNGKVLVKEGSGSTAAAEIGGEGEITVGEKGSIVLGGKISTTGTFTNNGTIALTNPAAKIPSAIEGSGTIDASGAQAEGTLSGSYDTTTTFTKNQIITATGDITLVKGTEFTFKGTFIIPEGVTVTIEDGARLVAADATGKIVNNGTIVVESSVAMGGLYLSDTATIENNGTIDLAYEGTSTQWTAFLKQGTFTNNGTLTVGDESNLILGESGKKLEFNNNGTIVIYGEIHSEATGVTILNSGLFQMNGRTYTDFTIYQMSTDASVEFNEFTNMSTTSNPVTITVSDAMYKSDDSKYDHTSSTVAVTVGYMDVISGVKVVLSVEKDSNGKYFPQFVISGNVLVNTEEENGTAYGAIVTGGDNVVSEELTIGENVTLTIGGKLKVSGQISAVKNSSVGFASTSDILTVTGKVSIVSASALTGGIINAVEYAIAQTTTTDKTYVYTTLDQAVAAGAKKITVYGETEVAVDVTVPSGTTVTINTDAVLTVGKDSKTTFASGAVLKNNATIDVEGTLYVEVVKTALKPEGTIDSQVVIKGEADRTYTTLANAIAIAAAGSTIELSGNVVLDKDLTIPEGIKVDTNGHTFTINADVTLTVDGELFLDGSASTVTMNKKDVTKVQEDGAFVVNGTVSSTDDILSKVKLGTDAYTVPGAYYQITVKTDTTYYVQPVAKAAAKIAEADDSKISIRAGEKGIVAGDVSFAGTADEAATVEVYAKLTVSSFTLDLASVVFMDDVEFKGAITNGAGTVTMTGVAKTDLKIASSTSKDVKTLTVTGQFADAEDEQSLVVAGDVVFKNAIISKVVVDGNAQFDKTSSANTTSVGILVINGKADVKNGAVLNVTDRLEVLGTLAAAAMTDDASAGSVSAKDAYIGVAKKDVTKSSNTTGAAASVTGKVTAAYAVVADGSSVPETITDAENVKSTQYFIGDKAYVTAYAVAATDSSKKIGDIWATVENAKFTGWYSDAETRDPVDDKAVGSEGNEKVYAIVNYKIYSVEIVADAGIENIAIDGNLVGDDNSVDGLIAGTHTVTYTLKNGYSGTAVLSVNGEKQSGMTFSVSGKVTDYKLQLTGITASGYTPAPVEPAQDDKDDGLSLTDILLIILVVLIVVMAIIVALRLMRS